MPVSICLSIRLDHQQSVDQLGSQLRLAQLNCYRKADRAEQSKADETGGPSRIVRFSLASTSANVTQSSDNQRDEDRDKAGEDQTTGEPGTGVAGTPTSERARPLSPSLSVLNSASAQPSFLLPMILIYLCVCVSVWYLSALQSWPLGSDIAPTQPHTPLTTQHSHVVQPGIWSLCPSYGRTAHNMGLMAVSPSSRPPSLVTPSPNVCVPDPHGLFSAA